MENYLSISKFSRNKFRLVLAGDVDHDTQGYSGVKGHAFLNAFLTGFDIFVDRATAPKLALAGDVDEDAGGQEDQDQGGAAVGDEGQGDAG